MKVSGIHWLTNYQCNFNCEHCFFDTQKAGPFLSAEMVAKVLADLNGKQNLKWMHFSGGEPLLNEENLEAVVKTARSQFSGAIGLSTNAYWAASTAVANQKVAWLKSIGVDGIAVSCDAFHQAFRSVEYPARAVKAIEAHQLKKHSYLIGTLLKDDQKDAGAKNALTRELLRLAKGGTEIPIALPENRAIGKGRLHLPEATHTQVLPCSELSCCLGQRSPFNPAMIWIDPYGNVLICYGVKVGNILEQDLSEILENYDPQHHVVTQILSGETPDKLGRLVDNADELRFYDSCDACYQLRKMIKGKYPECIGPDEHFPV